MNKLKEEWIGSGSWFEDTPSIMAGKAWGKLAHIWMDQETEIREPQVGSGFPAHKPAPSNPHLPARPHLFKVPQPPSAAPQTRG